MVTPSADEMPGPFVGPSSRGQGWTLVGPWRPIFLVPAFAAALGVESDQAGALEVEEAAASQGCLSQPDGSSDHPACYESMLACVLAAFAHASSCTQRPNPIPSTGETLTRRTSAPLRPARRRAHSSSQQHQLSRAERNELWFQEWQERSTHE
jgi:hypothetical protein